MFDAQKLFIVQAVDRSMAEKIQHKIDQKTKPPGSLGVLENVALQIALIQKTLTPSLQKPQMLLFAGDHGIVAEGVSPFPQVVTQQMVHNFVNGGAAINVFCRQHNIAIDVIDAGVNGDLSSLPITQAKVANGTKNFLHEKAMTAADCEQAIARGAALARAANESGCNVIGFGEMGIGNTSSATALFSALSGTSVEECVGRGTGLDDKGLLHKTAVLKAALAKHGKLTDPFTILCTFGGFEIAMMVGAILAACEQNMLVLIDGFIASSAAAIAFALEPHARDYCVFSHLSNESGHKKMLDYLQVSPLASLGLRLGEGSGVAITYPLIESAVLFFNEMASFDSAGIDGKADA
ncbi:MAG TPA: nicotinate-nucleotide--dimethylbenzimidazole phosphoribosyltransferase [Pseudomonadales bacterium]|nr:nicotinate-nucleotide--dimethylbenzimidazole phosphoribosyltransferase [Pseudomonadales bacterium]